MYVNQKDGSNETHIWKLLAVLLAFTLIAAACGDDDDVTLLLVEQNADMALAHCKRFCVIRNVEIALEGVSDDYVDDPTPLQSAYLGV